MNLTAPACLAALVAVVPPAQQTGWTSEFGVDPRQLVANGASPYFILDPGYQLVLEQADDRLVVTVLDQTRIVDGVATRVVEERETEAGRLVEVSRNFFARDPRSGDVYYFGEEVDIYKNGRVVGHDGAWLSGVNGARFGLFIAGRPAVGDRYYQEIAPKVAMDRVRVVSTTATASTRAGIFQPCVRLEETTPLEPGVKDYKLFAKDIGLVQDAALKLVRYGRPKP